MLHWRSLFTSNSLRCGAPAEESLRRACAGIFRRWHDRSADHESGKGWRPARDLAYLRDALQGVASDPSRDRPAVARRRGRRGSGLAEGGRVRITAQLVEASTDRHLWAET